MKTTLLRIAAVVGLALACGSAACSGNDATTGQPNASASISAARPGAAQRDATPWPSGVPRVVDAPLVAFLSKARAVHHNADLAESKDDLAQAIAYLELLTDGPRPERSPESNEVLADAHARLADLRSRNGDYEGAKREIERGLDLAREVTHYRGHLYEILGVIEERQMEELKKKGDTHGAEAAKERAIQAFEKAIEIQDEVINQALENLPPDSMPTTSALPRPSSAASAQPSSLP
ncbi:MAG: hypothetical protein U0271_26280 [Polyangiaceae bacterium]